MEISEHLDHTVGGCNEPENPTGIETECQGVLSMIGLSVATNQKTRQGLKPLSSQVHRASGRHVATNQKTRQGLKHIQIETPKADISSCNEPENPTGIET